MAGRVAVGSSAMEVPRAWAPGGWCAAVAGGKVAVAGAPRSPAGVGDVDRGRQFPVGCRAAGRRAHRAPAGPRRGDTVTDPVLPPPVLSSAPPRAPPDTSVRPPVG